MADLAKEWDNATPIALQAEWDKSAPISQSPWSPEGTTQGIMSLASSTIAAPVAGLAGLAASAIPGLPQGTGRDVVNKVSNALTYQPRSATGQAIVDTASVPFNWLAKKADQAGIATTDATGSPILGTAVNTALQAAPMAVLKGVSKLGAESAESIAARTKLRSLNSLRDETLKAGQEAGYVLPPSVTDPTFLKNRMEGVADKAALTQETQVRNQAITNKLAREELGLPDNQPISVGALDKFREQAAEPYREVASLEGLPAQNIVKNPNTRFPIRYSGPTPIEPAVALEKLKQARFDANEQWRYYDRSGEPKARIAAQAADATAENMQSALEQAAKQAGRDDLIPKLQEARTQIAKSYDIERALNDANGNVDARIIGRAFDSGKKLTGNLDLIGRFATAFKPYVREGSMVPTPGVSKSEGIAAAVLGIGGHAALGPYGAGLAAAPFLSSPVRAYLLSHPNQVMPNYGPNFTQKMLNSLSPVGTGIGVGQGLFGQPRSPLLNPQQGAQ